MKKNFHKQATILFIVMILLLLVFLAGVYILKNNILNSSQKEINNHDISLKFVEENAITIANMLPISDAVGKRIQSKGDKEGVQGYFDFIVQSQVSEKINYEIYLTRKSFDKEIEPNYVKLYLTDAVDDKPVAGYDKNRVPTYSDLRVSTNNLNGRRLYFGSLSNKESKKFRLRMWLSDTYVLTAEEKKFAVKINVKVN